MVWVLTILLVTADWWECSSYRTKPYVFLCSNPQRINTLSVVSWQRHSRHKQRRGLLCVLLPWTPGLCLAVLDRSTGENFPGCQIAVSHLGVQCVGFSELTGFLQQASEEQPEGMVTVAIAAHYLSGEDKRSSQLDALKEKFPDWVFPSAWVCTYSLFVF